MSRERTDNEVLLDYTDLFGPGRAPVRISIKNFKLQARLGPRPGSITRGPANAASRAPTRRAEGYRSLEGRVVRDDLPD